MLSLDDRIKFELGERLSNLEEHLDADVAFYYGQIHPDIQRRFREFIEQLKGASRGTDHLAFVLNTPGGSVETVEKLVEILRFHYKTVSFIMPDWAMSAGTIFCMSGDKIYMEYSSSLGPIDPQVFNGTAWVPALGYLDQVERMIEKAAAGTLSPAEIVLLQSLDLAMLSRYEQARALTVTLLKKWLVDYKFKDWTHHRTDPTKILRPVTRAEKEQRAEEIARELGNNRTWHSHGRMIGPITLRNVLRLEVEEYSEQKDLRDAIRGYNDLVVEYIAHCAVSILLHSKNTILDHE